MEELLVKRQEKLRIEMMAMEMEHEADVSALTAKHTNEIEVLIQEITSARDEIGDILLSSSSQIFSLQEHLNAIRSELQRVTEERDEARGESRRVPPSPILRMLTL